MKTAALMLLEKTLNHYVALDPYAANLRLPLNNKIIKIVARELPLDIYLKFTLEKITLLEHSDLPDAIIRGSLLNFARLSQRKNKATAMQELEIVLEGDIDTAMEFQTFWASLYIDWTEIIAKFTGDPIAVALNRGVNLLKRAATQIHTSTTTTLTEYLQEEIRLIPPRAEIQDFMDDVDRLRVDGERLVARIQRLSEGANSNVRE